MSSHKIGIIGLGLIGGSIAKGLEGKKEILLGEEHLEEVDILVLAVPLSAILEIGEKLAARQRKRPLIIFDVGSVKGEIARRFEALSSPWIEFVATHPMAGKEESGFEHSDAALFQGAPWIVTPHAKNTEAGLGAVEEIIRLLGARPLRMSGADHDRRAALVSHVPYLLSKALLAFAEERDPACLAMAGPGFRSMTRLAKDNPEMRREIGAMNEKNIRHELVNFIAFLETFS